MPKFVPMFEVSESDDEIEIIPYVKPLPPLIDILNSSSGEEDVPQTSPSKSEKKKKKKKKRDEGNTVIPNGLSSNNNNDNDQQCGDNNASSSSGTTSQKSTVGIDSDNIPQKDIVNGTDNEQVGYGNNVELSPRAPGSENAAAPSSLSNSDDIISSDVPLPSIRIANSIFEISEPLDQPAELILPSISRSNPAGKKNIAAGTRRVAQSKSKDQTKVSPVSARGTPRAAATRTRVSKNRIASQRTNEEIINFLTTLGIPLEPQDLDPNKRVRKPRKQPVPESVGTPVGNVSNGLLPETIPNGIRPVENSAIASPAAFESVSVTDLLSIPGSILTVDSLSKETPLTARKSPKRRISHLNKRLKIDNSKADASDLSLATLTKQDLENVRLKMTSNVICPSDNQNKYRRNTKQASIVDSIMLEMDRLNNELKTKPPEVELSDQQSASGLRLLLPDSMKPSSTTKDSVDVSQIPEPCPSGSETLKLNKSLNRLLESQNEFVLAPVAPLNSSSSLPTMPNPETITFHQGGSADVNLLVGNPMASADVINVVEKIAHLPSHWSEEMIKFYDTIRDPDLHTTEVLRCLSDNPALWRLRRLPPKPKLKKIRCGICHQWGHLSKYCTEKRKKPCCKICGATGHIDGARGKRPCINAVCLNCGRQQYSFSTGCRDCVESRHPMKCSLCLIAGHEEPMCPDNWRRFHSVTSVVVETNGNVKSNDSVIPLYVGEQASYKPNRDLYCSNCAKKGHSYYYCKQNHRMNSYHRSKPYVVKELPGMVSIAPPTQEPDVTPKSSTAERTVSVQPDYVANELPAMVSIAPPTREHDLTSKSSSTERTVSVQPEENDDDDGIEIIKVHIANEFATNNENKTVSKSWRCVNYPDCQNYPSIGNKCHNMFLTESDHAFLIKAQDEEKIAEIRGYFQVDVTVLSEKCIVHVWGENHLSAIEELTKLLARQKKANNKTNKLSNSGKKKSAAPTVSTKKSLAKKTNIHATVEENDSRVPSIPECSSSFKKFISDSDNDKAGTSGSSSLKEINGSSNSNEMASVKVNENCQIPSISTKLTENNQQAHEVTKVPSDPTSLNTSDQKPESPEIITLEDDEVPEPGAGGAATNPTSSLSVSLLSSEWHLIFAESTKIGGLTSKLAQQFGVSIFVCKEELSCTIQSGTPEDRKVAQQNIVFWLECAAANVEYKMLLGKDDYNNVHYNTDIRNANNSNKKRPRIDPKPNVLAKRKRIDDKNRTPSPRNRIQARRPRVTRWDQDQDPVAMYHQRRTGNGGRGNHRAQSNDRIPYQDQQFHNNTINQHQHNNNIRYFNPPPVPEYMQNQQLPPPGVVNFGNNSFPNNWRGKRNYGDDFSRRGGNNRGSGRGRGGGGNGSRGRDGGGAGDTRERNNRLAYYNQLKS